MELKEIQELIKFVSKTNIGGLKLKQGDFEIHIKNQHEVHTVVQQTPQVVHTAAPVVNAAPAASTAPAVTATTPAAAPDSGITFKSPMIGTFYRRPGADKDMFVKPGDVVKAGQTICIIEAMKLFNEIEWEGEDARIVKILVEDAQPVEYDQPLFLVEKA